MQRTGNKAKGKPARAAGKKVTGVVDPARSAASKRAWVTMRAKRAKKRVAARAAAERAGITRRAKREAAAKAVAAALKPTTLERKLAEASFKKVRAI